MKKFKSMLAVLLAMLMIFSCAAVSYATDDGNGSAATAAKLGTDNAGVKEFIESADDKDYYYIIPDDGGLATVALEHAAIAEAAAGSSYFKVEIFDGEETLIAEFVSEGNQAKAVSPKFAVSKGEKYYVCVSKGDVINSTLEYTVSASINNSALVESEPNDETGKATAIKLSEANNAQKTYRYYGNISSENDADIYKFTLSAPGLVYVYIYNSENSDKGSFKATLGYSSEVAGGASVLNESLGTVEVKKADSYNAISDVGLGSGEYFVKVTGIGGSKGGYSVIVINVPVSDAETEPNNIPETADPAPINALEVEAAKLKIVRACLNTADDVDYFKITVPSGSNGYNIKVAASAGASKTAGSWKVTVLSSAGKEIVAETTATDKAAATLTTDAGLAAGTYYIKVIRGTDYNPGVYTVSVQVKEKKADEGEKDKSWIDKIKDLDWQGFVDNFATWIDEINILGLIGELTKNLPDVFKIIKEVIAKVIVALG